MARRHSRINRRRPDIALALSLGWEYLHNSGSGHFLFRHPGTSMKLVLASTPGRGRSEANSLADIRRYTPKEVTA